jgi:hypothetical protein
MSSLRRRAVLFSLVLGAGAAGAEPPATPTPNPQSAPQHVTVPSLPGDKNKEGTVRPDGGMPMDSEGYAVTKRYDPGAPPAKASPAAAPAGKAAPAPAAGGAAAAQIPVGPAPTGKMAVTGENYINVRGTLVSVEPGKSVTIRLQKTGTENTYTLAPGAAVPAGLEPGKTVRVRVLAAQKGKVADRVERIDPTPAPKK